MNDPLRFDFSKTAEHRELRDWYAGMSDYSFPDDAEFDLLLEQARRQWDHVVRLMAAQEAKAEKFLATLAVLAIAAVGVYRLTDATWIGWLGLPISLGFLSALCAMLARYPQPVPDVVSTRELADWHRQVTQRASRQFFLATNHHWAVVEAKALMRRRALQLRHAIHLAIDAGIVFVIIALFTAKGPEANRVDPPTRESAPSAVEWLGPGVLVASDQSSDHSVE